ncbi:hypothetical protein ACIQVO_23025 [Streptomyces sp. NPDC101062]|uniref:hypothetical protein n=1 Tax=unclassified Streptomyces TaxID=2593676 RepID=UPI00381D87C9
MDAYLLAGDLLVATAFVVTLRRGRTRRTALCAAGLAVAGGLMLGAGSGFGVLVCAVSALGAAALLLAELTTVRRSALAGAWAVAVGLLVMANVRYEQAGSWVAYRKPWVVVFSLALVAALSAAAVATARLARDPDMGPGGV